MNDTRAISMCGRLRPLEEAWGAASPSHLPTPPAAPAPAVLCRVPQYRLHGCSTRLKLLLLQVEAAALPLVHPNLHRHSLGLEAADNTITGMLSKRPTSEHRTVHGVPFVGCIAIAILQTASQHDDRGKS